MKTFHRFCPLLCVLGLAACDSTLPPPPPPELQAVPQPLLLSTSMQLGEGYSLVADDPTGVVCVEGPLLTTQSRAIDRIPIFSFYVDRPQEIRSKAIDVFSTQSPYTVFEPSSSINGGLYDNGLGRNGLEQFVGGFFDGPEPLLRPTQNKNDQLLIIAVEMPTVVNELIPEQCGQAVAQGDYQAAITQCGDTYLHSESYGGLMFLALPRPELQDPQIMAKVDNLLRVNSVNHNLDAETTLNGLQTLLDDHGLGGLEFSILLPQVWFGLPAVQTIINQQGTNDRVKAVEGREILQALIIFTQNAITNSSGYIANPQAQGLGHKMRRRLKSYESLEVDPSFSVNSGAAHWFESCGIAKPQDYQCYLDFAGELGYLQELNQKGGFHRTAAYFREALTRRSEFAWPLDPTTYAPYYTAFESFLTMYDQCVGPPSAFAGALGDCRERLVSEPSALCSACDMANFPSLQDCTNEILDQAANSLPQIFEKAAFTPPIPYPIPAATRNSTVQMQSPSDYICTLSRIGGNLGNTNSTHYTTSNPGAGLALDNSTPPRFVLQRTSYYPSHISLGGNCIAKSAFYGTNFPGNEPWISQVPAFVSEVIHHSSTSDIVTTDPAAAGALLGVTGNFRGTGETAWARLHKPNSNSASLFSEVYQAGAYGKFKSHTTPFGLVTSLDGIAQHYELSNNDYQVEIRTSDGDSRIYQNADNVTIASSSRTLFASKDYVLAPTDEAYCHLTKISGDFDGGGERVALTTRGADWILNVHSAYGKTVRAEARCYRYNQRDPAP